MLDTIRNIIRNTLWDIDMWSREAEQLVYHTGLVESGYRRLRQYSGGPARSWWQVEPSTAIDNRDNYLIYRLDRLVSICQSCGIDIDYLKDADENDMSHLLEINIAFAICMARIKYYRVPYPIPQDVRDQAEYWLQYYNAGGKGSVDKFMEAVA